MGWEFWAIVGGSLVLALAIYFIGRHQEKAEDKGSSG